MFKSNSTQHSLSRDRIHQNMSNTVFPPVRDHPYVYENNTYDVKGTPDDVKERISNVLDNAPCQYRYDETRARFHFHFYSPEKSEGCVNCFTVSEGLHKVEFQRLDGLQVHFYTELYKCLHALGLREAGPNSPAPEICGLLHAPVKETVIALTYLSSTRRGICKACTAFQAGRAIGMMYLYFILYSNSYNRK